MKRQWRIIRLETSRRRLKKHFLNASETPLKKAYALALGVFIGVLPLWGIQVLSALFSAHYFKLNKPLAVVGSYINVTPLLPIIIYLSLRIGLLILGIHDVNLMLNEITLSTATAYLGAYLIGSIPIAFAFSVLFGGVAFVFFNIIKNLQQSIKTASKQLLST